MTNIINDSLKCKTLVYEQQERVGWNWKKSMRTRFLGLCMILGLLVGAVGCNVKRPSEATAALKHDEHSPQPTYGGAQRFVFPSQSAPFPAASVALDTRSGQLCKTYSWPDTKTLPSGLSLCSEAADVSCSAGETLDERLTDALAGRPSYSMTATNPKTGQQIGSNDEGQTWYDRKTGKLFLPESADPFDLIGLFSKEQKGKTLLSASEIQTVANKFGISYQKALQDAKNQGYQVPK